MGSGSSREAEGWPPPPAATAKKVNCSRSRQTSSGSTTSTTRTRTRTRFPSFICGSSSSSTSSPPREDCGSESLVDSVDHCQQLRDKSPSPTNEYILTSSGGTGFTSRSIPTYEPGASSENSTAGCEDAIEDDSHTESSGKRKCFSGSDANASFLEVNAENKHYQERLGGTVSASSTRQIWSGNISPHRHSSGDVHDLVSSDMPQACSGVISPTPSSMHSSEVDRLSIPLEAIDEEMENSVSGSDQIPVTSDPVRVFQSHGDEVSQEVSASGIGLFVADRVQVQPEGSAHHVDVVSISSNVLPNNNEIRTREAQRNSRRMFWDAFSSRSSRRYAELPAVLFATEDVDLMGPRRRWLLDVGDDFFSDGVGMNSWHFGRRSRATNGHRHNSRSESWHNLQSAASGSGRHTSCPFSLHPDGSCSCESYEEANALSSISRIVLLAEALFEVLDEIHRQPESLSLSMHSVPASASTVDSLPIKTYEKANIADSEDMDQCYICLVEYENGDKIRILPCHHEYHRSCVDRWLKEIHGVCPLCRGDVRGGGTREGAVSSSGADLT